MDCEDGFWGVTRRDYSCERRSKNCVGQWTGKAVMILHSLGENEDIEKKPGKKKKQKKRYDVSQLKSANLERKSFCGGLDQASGAKFFGHGADTDVISLPDTFAIDRSLRTEPHKIKGSRNSLKPDYLKPKSSASPGDPKLKCWRSSQP